MRKCHRPVASSALLFTKLLIVSSSLCLLCSAWTQNSGAPQHQLTRRQLPPSARARWKSSWGSSASDAVFSRTTTTATTELWAKSKSKSGTCSRNNSDDDDVVVALLHSHHLLDHKPDNLLLKGGKYKLRGVACLGRPGVALCIGPAKAHARFKKALESAMPQKRFKTKVLGDSESPLSSESSGAVSCMEGFAQAETLGDFRKVLASIDQEAEFFELTGIADPSSSPISGNGTNNAEGGRNGGGKKNKRQRKRKK
eukprot:CAMPEP_0172387168 /NCGR_PEP_ID=MMETSP1061-20121228/4533_1 /TAXON_ID=37318 /ORGANISM="Pseudo-nitzschia pungens, Strain cf. pungens" /LENGTH=254 /DNA_ID=CAMNT_0013116739 /DNA_START=52 /DNA_END=816 /DNA_ORIENTATION=-